jgi:osmotically-inducible protein OsmY
MIKKEDSLTANSQLKDRVAIVLEQNPHLSARTLRCEAAEGHVVLRGTVRSYYQKQMAQEMLKTVDGVDTIENQLEVCWQ